MLEKAQKMLRERNVDGRITCAQAEAIAAECGLSRRQVGDLINELELKITTCQLGCF
ncbi:MAG: hypothetical protein JXO49_07335 [Deltaproteobacteria bacterium]|nr:hypothetical protein [Candidatus Anaeroferrophillus wilburensis]MBN2889141.1 hypothetical protein [Deltaproteobacteria bacterium]